MRKANYILFVGLIVLCGILILISLGTGSVGIPISEVFQLLGSGQSENLAWQNILFGFRLPKTATAILVGIGLPCAGLIMQTYFRNALAGPYVLGVSSGSSLGAALFILVGGTLSIVSPALQATGLILSALVGSFLVMLTIMAVSKKVTSSVTLLILGLMFSSMIGAVVSVLQYFSGAEDIQQYVLWSMGSLSSVSGFKMTILASLILISWLMIYLKQKDFNAIILGEDYATSMGVSVKRLRTTMIISSSILAGSITAFCGPVAFVGIAVPHLARTILKSADHRLLIPATSLIGISLILLCDIIAQLPGSNYTLPINAITSLIGGPIVIAAVLKYGRRG